jgi:hypothetical protein
MVEGPHGGCPLSVGVFTREVVALPYRLVVLSNQLLGDRHGCRVPCEPSRVPSLCFPHNMKVVVSKVYIIYVVPTTPY